MSFESAFINATVAPDTTVVNSTMDWIMSKMDQFPLKLSFFFACTMVIGSVVPYIPQYFTIKQTQNTEGFSLYVCLTLLVANILRIMFWFGKHFETALLIQSIVMILAMFGLLELCVRVRNSNLIIQGRRHYFAGGESDPKKTNGNGDVTVVTAAVDSVVIGNIDSKSALVNGDLKNDDLSKAVTRSTVSSTILNQLVIPNPNSILNQLTSSSSPSPSSPPTSSLNDQTATMNVSVNNNESRSQCNTAPIATSNSSDSVGSTGRRCIVIAQQRQSSISSQSSSQPTSPKDLCAANLPAQISSSNASSVSECTSIISKPQFIPKQNEQSKHESSAESSDCSQPNNNVDDHSDLDGANGDDGASKDLLIEMNHDEDDDDDGEQTGTKYSIQMGDDNRPNDDGSSPTEKLMVAVLTSSSEADTLPTRRHFLDFDLRYFWEWTDFISYLECMAIFAFFTGLLMYFFINQPLVVEGYGLVALVTESLLASPQFVRNFKAKSTEGMSRMMVFTWFLGDLYKTVYFVVRSAPFQFILCGFTQITFDVLIFIQVLIYKKASYAKLAKAGKAGVNQVNPTIQESDQKAIGDANDANNGQLKARHVSFSNPEASQSPDQTENDKDPKLVEEIAMHKLD